MVDSDVPASVRKTRASGKSAEAVRAPRQPRGQARVDAILDAAAEVIAEQGVAGVTMHALARRAKTSIGSMYHFFPDLDSVLNVLSDRHAVAVREINRQLNGVPAEEWQALGAEAAIERLLRPYVEYLRRHGDYLPLMHGRASIEDDADFIRTIRLVLDARMAGLEPTVRENTAVMMHAIAAGAMHAGFKVDPGRADLYLREIPRVLALYLADIEAASPS